MNLDLDGRVALVTGSTNGIGAAIARTLAAEGATVIVHGRNSERAEQVAADIVDSGGQAFVVTADLGNDAGAESLVVQAEAAAGRIDDWSTTPESTPTQPGKTPPVMTGWPPTTRTSSPRSGSSAVSCPPCARPVGAD